MHARVREWLWRYLPAEAVSIVGTMLPALVLANYGASRVSIALVGTWGGNISYFGTILIRDVMRTRNGLCRMGHRYTWRSFLKNLRDMLIEFGVAEVLDSFLIRPALMYWLPIRAGSLGWGLIAAKFLADLSFYAPAIFFYEWNKRRKPDSAITNPSICTRNARGFGCRFGENGRIRTDGMLYAVSRRTRSAFIQSCRILSNTFPAFPTHNAPTVFQQRVSRSFSNHIPTTICLKPS